MLKGTRAHACLFGSYPEKESKMDYGMIGKIEKSKRYAEERERFQFKNFELTFEGDNNPHRITFEDGLFQCDCEFFMSHQRCGHTMALEILLKDMIPVMVDA